LNKPLIAERIRPLFPDEASFNQFMDRVGIENTYNLTKNAILSGSATQERQAAQALFQKRTQEFSPDKNTIVRRGLEWLRGARKDTNLNVSDDVINELSDTLLTEGTITPDLINKLMRTPFKEKVSDFINIVTAPATTAVMSQTPEIPQTRVITNTVQDILPSSELTDEDVFQ
jgi:hypothetical protein